MRWVCLFLFAWAAIGAAATNGPVKPVSIFVKEKQMGRWGYNCDVVLTITNTHAFPVWYVMARAGNDFLGDPWDFRFILRMEISERNDGHGRTVMLHSYGHKMFGFKAILLPPGADFRAEILLDMLSWRDEDFLNIWEAKRLLVNGKVPLEKWLGGSVVSSRTVRIGRVNKVHAPVWETAAITSAKEFADQKVEWVKAEPIEQFVVPLLGPIEYVFGDLEGACDFGGLEGVYVFGPGRLPVGLPIKGMNQHGPLRPEFDK